MPRAETIFPRLAGPNSLVACDATGEGPSLPKSAPRDQAQRLGSLFVQLGPGTLDALDEIWDLCATDLYGLALWRTGSPQDAEDALQEVFVRLARSAEQGQLKKVRDPRAYLLAMTHRAAIDTLRQRRKHHAADVSEMVDFVQASDEHQADAARLSTHLARLPEGQRTVVYLKHFLGMTFREIGSALRIPTFTAASRYRLALGRLRQHMGLGK